MGLEFDYFHISDYHIYYENIMDSLQIIFILYTYMNVYGVYVCVCIYVYK